MVMHWQWEARTARQMKLYYHQKSPGGITHSSLILAKLIMKCLPLSQTHSQTATGGRQQCSITFRLTKKFWQFVTRAQLTERKGDHDELPYNISISFPEATGRVPVLPLLLPRITEWSIRSVTWLLSFESPYSWWGTVVAINRDWQKLRYIAS